MSTAEQILKEIDTLTVSPVKFGKNKDGTPKQFASSVIKVCRQPLRLKLTGDLFMLPNKTEHEEYGVKYSLGVEFSTKDCEIFDAILDKMGETDGYERKEAHDDGKIFFSLKPNTKSTDFTCPMNIPIKPLKLSNDRLDLGMEVTVHFTVGGWWLSGDDPKYGLTFKIKTVHYGPLDAKVDPENPIPNWSANKMKNFSGPSLKKQKVRICSAHSVHKLFI